MSFLDNIVIIDGTGFPVRDLVVAYTHVGVVVCLTFVVQRAAWGHDEAGYAHLPLAVRVCRVAVVGFLLGLFWLPILTIAVLVLSIAVVMGGA